MGFATLWILGIASAILTMALTVACSARCRRPFLRWLFPSIILIFILAKSSLFIILSTLMALKGASPDWRVYVWSLFLLAIGGGILVVIFGLRKKNSQEPPVFRAASWNRGALAIGLLIVSGMNLITFTNMETAVKFRMTGLQAEAGALALSVAPARVPDSRNAALVYQQAFEAMPENTFTSNSLELELLVTKNRHNLMELARNKPELASFMISISQSLPLLRKATSMPECYFEHDYARPSISMTVPELSQLRQSARLLKISALSEAHSGNTKQAIADLQSIIMLSKHTGNNPILIAHLLSNSIGNMAFNLFEDLVFHTKPNSADLKGLSPTNPFVLPHALRRALLMEEAFGLSVFAGFSRDSRESLLFLSELNGNHHSSPIPGINMVASFVLSTWRVYYLSDELTAYRKGMRKHLNGLSIASHLWIRRRSSSSENTRPAGLITSLILPALQRMRDVTILAQARETIFSAAIVVTRHKSKTDSYPSSAAEFAALFPAGIPIDPCSGQPLKIKISPNGLIIYSVGLNSKDDNGLQSKGDNNKGDISFHMGSAYKDRYQPKQDRIPDKDPKEEVSGY
jgi:hypothetical protein